MSSLTGLSKRQVQVLWAVELLNRDGRSASGTEVLREFERSALYDQGELPSTQGIHQTAASLVRKGALGKVGKERPGRSPQVAYFITDHGRTLRKREVEVHGRPL